MPYPPTIPNLGRIVNASGLTLAPARLLPGRADLQPPALALLTARLAACLPVRLLALAHHAPCMCAHAPGARRGRARMRGTVMTIEDGDDR